MLPIGPLMIEHRLIERMIAIMKNEVAAMAQTKKVNPVFIDTAVDFIRMYADKTHHGKEEDILFRELKKKPLSPDHAKIMEELIQEHITARKTTGELVAAKEAYLKGDAASLGRIVEKFQTLAAFYPKHIEKEDKRFFVPIMKYFTKEEQDAMLLEGQVYDRKMIHRKYSKVVGEFETDRKIPIPKEADKWIEFM